MIKFRSSIMYVHVFTFVRKRGVESSVLLILPLQGIYKTFTRGMFRVGGNCNFLSYAPTFKFHKAIGHICWVFLDRSRT